MQHVLQLIFVGLFAISTFLIAPQTSYSIETVTPGSDVLDQTYDTIDLEAIRRKIESLERQKRDISRQIEYYNKFINEWRERNPGKDPSPIRSSIMKLLRLQNKLNQIKQTLDELYASIGVIPQRPMPTGHIGTSSDPDFEVL